MPSQERMERKAEKLQRRHEEKDLMLNKNQEEFNVSDAVFDRPTLEGILRLMQKKKIDKIKGDVRRFLQQKPWSNRKQISKAVAEMDRVVQQNAANAEESAAAAEEMSVSLAQVANTAEQTAGNINMVAAATEEMRMSRCSTCVSSWARTRSSEADIERGRSAWSAVKLFGFSTKEMAACIIGQRYTTIKNPGNFNNLIGLPQTLLQLDGTFEAAVVEMGMNRFGEIRRLTAAATCFCVPCPLR